MGRNAKPIGLHLAQGNPNGLTKDEINRRKKTEIKLGENKLRCPSFVKGDINAFAKWKEIVKIYKDIDFVSSGDTGLLARYCVTFGEYLRLCQTRNRIVGMDADWSKYEGIFPEEFQDSIEKLLRSNADLQIENAINKKADMLIKMEDRLFLNPLSKVKNVPKKEPEKENPLADKGFGNV
jgi:phage terminase small subunit